jgi:hypothetical protein
MNRCRLNLKWNGSDWVRLQQPMNQNGPFNFTTDRFKHAAVLTQNKCGSISQVDNRQYDHGSTVSGAAENHYGLP